MFQCANGFVILQFTFDKDSNCVLSEGLWFLNDQVLNTRPWEIGIELRRDLLSSVPIWIRLLLYVHLTKSQEALGRMASVLGKPVFID